MIRLLVRAAIFIGSAAIGLLVADAVLDDMSVSWTSLVVVAAIFAAIQSVIAPFLVKVTARNMPALVGGVGLFSVLIALMVTSWISDGLQISGAGTWLLAGLIV
ncbi:MAG: phage holin family protein, partial [Actinomycetia bacterium]|nr:phage holin family protein [Actinomycetes bacterium]